MSKRRTGEGGTRKKRDLLAPLLDGHNSAEEQEEARERLKKARQTIQEATNVVSKHTNIGCSENVDARITDRELIASRLRKAAVEARGMKAFEGVADRMSSVSFALGQTLRSEHRKHPITRVVHVSAVCGLKEEELLFSGDKGGLIIKWRREEMKNTAKYWRKQHVFKTGCSVQALAVSTDGRYLAAGLSDGRIFVWDGRTNKHLGELQPNQHRSAVLSIAFPPSSYQLYSASRDRTVKVWAVDQLAYLDTVYGHQDAVHSLCTLPDTPDRCATAGGRDRTVRLWKVAEESQLVLRLSETDGGSLDEIISIGKLFVSGSDYGKLSLWSSTRKKPLMTVPGHGYEITSLHSPEKTDLVVSGSRDGFLCFWKISGCDDPNEQPSIELVNKVPIPGHITGITGSRDELIVAISPEPRFGRWTVNSDIRPSLLVLSLSDLIRSD